ncbi:alpha/beta fold hydrolase [Streptomyces sp. NPDC048644]|uniref:alpha/beta fold hydrolase n=1 Tax=Streptomyces sp. NPDC048644 TaxID=3365582 RepID=UPI00371CB65B
MPYAHVNGTELHYEDHGTGPTALFLHGWGTSGRVWDAQVAALAPDHRVVTVDWRGCGLSARPATGNTAEANVADILALIDTLALDRPVLVGSSIGAAFALEAAFRAPDRIAGVVSVGGPGYWNTVSPEKAAQVAELRTSLVTDRAATAAAWVPTWYGPDTSPALIDQTVRQVLDASVFLTELFADGAPRDPRAFLGELPVPVLYLHGDLDLIPAEVSRTLADLTPQGEFHLFENTGHMPHQERPVAFTAQLRTALRRMTAPAHPTTAHAS